MAVQAPIDRQRLFVDKSALQRAAEELNARLGVSRDPAATAEQSQEALLALGIRPEDCEFSREIIRMRYEDE